LALPLTLTIGGSISLKSGHAREINSSALTDRERLRDTVRAIAYIELNIGFIETLL
jgi:hypothetical protein